MLKERIRVVCCPCYARGKHPERKVVKTVKATTRGCEGFLKCTQCVGVIKGTLSLGVRRLRNHLLLLLWWAHRFTGNSALGCKGFICPVARVGSGDPVRVLRLYTMITLDEVCSIYC